MSKTYERDPETGIRRIQDWGDSCGRGWVPSERDFTKEKVMKPKNRRKKGKRK